MDTCNPPVLHVTPLFHSQVGGSSTLTCYKDIRYTFHPSGPCDLASVRLNQVQWKYAGTAYRLPWQPVMRCVQPQIQDDIMRLTEHSLQVARLHSNCCTACQSDGNHSTSQITSCRLYHQPKPLMYSSILAKFPHVRLYNQPKSLIPGSPGAKIPHCCLYKEALPPSCNFSPADFLQTFPHITGKSLLTP